MKKHYKADRILMVDNIMPYNFFTSLLPALKRSKIELDVFYEQKEMKRVSGTGVKIVAKIPLPGMVILGVNQQSTYASNIRCLRGTEQSIFQ